MADGERLTVRIDADNSEYLDDLEEEIDADSRAEAVREALRRAQRADDRVERAESTADDLRRQLQNANARIDDVGELVEDTRETNALRRESQTLDRRRAGAGILTRAKWWLVGDAQARRDDTDE